MMIGLFIGLMIIFGFIECERLDISSFMYRAPSINKYTGRRTTALEAWIGRMIGDALILFAIFLIIGWVVSLF